MMTFEKEAPGSSGRDSQKSRQFFRPEKPVVKLQSTCFEKLIF